MPKTTNIYNFNYNSSKLSFFLLPKRHRLDKAGMRSYRQLSEAVFLHC